ncbi:MAG: molybdopterin-dependent oxidoreductase [Sphingomonadales bacterium]|nr:molybdopterin-dependent oxidoreductase [Sphingomonadales bacterium]
MGIKRRAFLIGGAALAGGGIFALQYGDRAGRRDALALTRSDKAGSFTGWLRIGEDDRVTLFTPHVDLGTGSATALAQMAADELDADWGKVVVEPAPVAPGFANAWLTKALLADPAMGSAKLAVLPDSVFSALARNLVHQITGGSSAVRGTGQHGFRVLAAAARQALVEEAAARLGVPAGELATANGVVTHKASGRALRYGQLATAAAGRELAADPTLKPAGAHGLIGQSVPRIDIPAKVDGSAKYGIDVALPGMRVATAMAAPVRGGKLRQVDPAPAMAIAGVEKVVKLDDAVAVVARGYWPALKGLRALSPTFDDGGKAGVSSATIVAEQEKLAAAKAEAPDAVLGRLVEASYRAPYLHHAMMETFALTAHFQGGRLEVWGGLQDPLGARHAAADAAGLALADVTFHAMPLGGGFGRKLPGQIEIIGQAVALAMQSPWPVKVIWPREEEVAQGTYRPQSATTIRAALGRDGRIAAWHAAFAQASGFDVGGSFPYEVPSLERKHARHTAHVITGSWRSVEASQHGFFNESFIDELAHAAGADPLEFRKRHLKPGSRAVAVLDAAAKASGWGTPLPPGTGRGIAVVESFGTVCAQVVQASLRADGYPKVEKVWAAVDCGQVINPRNAEAQVMGGIVMGLSSAIHEEITIDKGAVQQTSFTDYPLLTLAETPEIAVEFLNTGAAPGGLGEPGLPPAAPALANALFAATGVRVRVLPIRAQAGKAQG